MSEDWAGIAGEAAEAIASVGAPAAVLRRGADTGPVYNPTPGTAARTPTTAVDVGFERITVNGVLTEMRTFLVEAVSIKPLASDQLAFGGSIYSIESVKETAPAGAAVLYRVMVNYVGPDNG